MPRASSPRKTILYLSVSLDMRPSFSIPPPLPGLIRRAVEDFAIESFPGDDTGKKAGAQEKAAEGRQTQSLPSNLTYCSRS
jgi:hypothetical protein